MDRTILIVTYKRLNVTEMEAEEIVRESCRGDGYHGEDYRAVDAVAALSGGKEMEEKTIYHFNGMGSSTMIAWSEMEEYLNGQHSTQEVLTRSRLYDHPDVTSVCVCKHGVDLASDESGGEEYMLSSEPPTGREENLEMISANGTAAREFTGKGVKIAIMDTGIAKHNDLPVKGGVSFCGDDDDFRRDDFGHGTHCAGIAAGRRGGIAKEADLFSIKVANTKSANPTLILAGLGWALRNRMDVVSISLAGPADLTQVPSCANAVQALMAINCLVVASTGKTDNSDVGFLANTPGVIAVGGCDERGVLLAGTRIGGQGNHLTVVAPGTHIKTTFHEDHIYVDNFGGSSAAAPHVAGLIALIQQKFPGIPSLQVISRILASAQSIAGIPNQKKICDGVTLIDCNEALALS